MQSKTGPYLRTSITIESVMIDVLISLVPPLLAGMIFFGWRALWIVLLSTVTAVVTEAILLRAPLTLQGIFGDGSAAVTGMLVGLILPSTAAWWVPVLGSILAIALVKQTFGGLGYNIFNPALGARAVLLLAFTSQLVKFSAPFDTVTSATPLLSTTQFDWALFWGNVGGSIGETSVIAILLGGLYLLVKGHIDWRVPVGYVGAAFGMALLWGLDPWFTITAGGLLFGAVYMATDMVTSPVTPTGQLIYGIGCGVLTVFIRQYTPFPEGVTFAILTMNALVPLIESLTMPMIFGVGVSRETRFRGTAVSLGVVALTIIVLVLVNNMEPSTTPVLSDGHYLPIADLLETTEYEIVEEQGTRYYVTWDEEDNLQGAAFTAEQGGFNGPIRFLVVLDEELAVKHIEILEHQEDPGLGALITRTEFLDQFIGKKEDSGFSLGTDLDGVTGATISSRSFAAGVRRALENFHAVFFPSEDNGGWADGKYLGSAESFGGKLEVEVTVSGGKITKVDVLAHSDTPGISDGAIKGVPERIVAANTVKVEAVSGATISSGAVMDAVENALQGAMEETAASADVFTLPADDGTYRGVGQGFGGDLVVDVTVSEGRISEIVVVEHGETPFVADPALKKLIPAIIGTQGPVDAVSGATMTSKGLMEALENALSGEAELEAAVQAFEITVDDGTYRGVGQGFGGDLVVDVTLSEGRISEIVVVEHGETPFVADPALKKLIPAIIETQGPVDAVSGATMTSKGLMEALENALSGEAELEETVQAFEITVDDGTYRGVGQGFGGDLVVDVTVSEGRISEIVVVEHGETPFVADPALKKLIPAIIETQGPVDAVSGATMTSKGLMEALENALSGDAELETAEVQAFEITVDDGTYRGVGQGFGGDLLVDVTVSEGRISEIVVVEHGETPFVADPALKKLIPAIIERQGPVDAVSGATMTSKGLEEALRSALNGKEGQ